MVSTHSNFRTIAALVLLFIVCAVTVSLGRWQLHRADERRALTDAMQAARSLPPLDVTAATAQAELTPWRPARVTGTWLPERTVLLENRNHLGRPGYWIATPLRLDDRPEQDLAVLVLRGWMPRALEATPTPETPPPAPSGQQTIEGELMSHVPRLFELGSGQHSRLPQHIEVGPGEAPPVVQNLELSVYGIAADLDLVPAVLMQIRPADDGLVHDWPQPALNYNQNQGYAFQWFAFASIAACAWLVVAWRAARRKWAARPGSIDPPGSS